MKKRTFQKLLNKHKDRVFGYAFYMVRNREDAEDIAQDVFIRLWENWDSIDAKKVVGWMMRVTHNCCIDLIRQKKASGGRLRVSGSVEPGAVVAKSNSHADPASQYELTETQALLLSALDALPEQTKSMMLLHYFHGLKYETIGEMLNTKVSTVKVAVHRGRKRLRDVLAEQFPERVGKHSNACAVS